jgi:hypothetical protein
MFKNGIKMDSKNVTVMGEGLADLEMDILNETFVQKNKLVTKHRFIL